MTFKSHFKMWVVNNLKDSLQLQQDRDKRWATVTILVCAAVQ